MSENLFNYIVLIIVVLILSLVYYKTRECFQSIWMISSSKRFSKKLENGYLKLLDLLYYNSNRYGLKQQFKKISSQRSDGRYLGGYSRLSSEFDAVLFSLDYFYDIMNYCDGRDENFILALDSNTTIDKFNQLLKESLEDVANNIEFLNQGENLGDRVLDDNRRIELYQNALHQYGVQMAFFQDGSNVIYLILHPIGKKRAVKRAIADIGFKYAQRLN